MEHQSDTPLQETHYIKAQEILNKMLEVYANLDCYSDNGTVESPGLCGPGLEFQTHFKRPLKYRFRWISRHPYLGTTKPADEDIITSNGTTFTSNHGNKIEDSESFSMMLAGAAGISRGAAIAIVNILSPVALELFNYWFRLVNTRRLPDENMHDFECFHIIGTSKVIDDVEVWIEKNSFIVRRIKETTVIDEAKSNQLNSKVQSPENIKTLRHALQNAGVTKKMIETVIDALPNSFQQKTYQHVYDYPKVNLNQPINDIIFGRVCGEGTEN
jgi:hypothetical protein